MQEFSFRPLELEDLEWARVLHNDPEVLSMLTDPHEVSRKEQFAWFRKLEQTKTSERLVAEWKGTVIRIGLVRVDNIDRYNRSLCLGLDICKEFRGKGFAKEIYKALFSKYFADEDINRIWLLVAEYNKRARHIYKSLGFKTEGVEREALFKNSKFYDYIMMSILKKEWLENNG